ncbi:MAG: PIN domain-containing protein [Bacteroidota bacterium]
MKDHLTLIDSDIFIDILKRKSPTYERGLQYLKEYGAFNISCLTYYECLRGYKAVKATKKLAIFEQVIQTANIYYIDDLIIQKASELYAFLRPKGLFRGEFDLMIGTTALINDFTLITNNEKHYKPMQEHFDLRVENWSKH